MTLINALMMFTAAFLGGLVQSVTGFGGGIVMMVIIPTFLPIVRGAAVSSLISLPLTLAMVWTYRKQVRASYVLRPFLFYVAASTLAICLAAGYDLSFLSVVFGVVLILLSIYFLFFSDRIRVKANWLSAGICGSISGAVSGLFGIGGPPMVIYYMALTGGDKLMYLGNIQAFFAITGVYTLILRIANGLLTWELMPFVAVGIVASLLGKFFGTKIVTKINAELLKKLVYGFLAISGILNLLS